MPLFIVRVSPGIFPLTPGMCEVCTLWWVGRIFIFCSTRNIFYKF